MRIKTFNHYLFFPPMFFQSIAVEQLIGKIGIKVVVTSYYGTSSSSLLCGGAGGEKIPREE